MSVYYEVKEHLVVKDIPQSVICNRSTAVKAMIDQLALLGALMLQDEAKVYESKLIADEKIIEFRGTCPNETYKEMLSAMENAKNLELVIEYEYIFRAGNEISHEAGPVHGGWMKDMDEEEAEGIFYSMWTLADCDDGAGIAFAYGEHNGKFYNGELEFENVEVFPEGRWYADSELYVYGENLSDEVLAEAEKIYRELSVLSLDKYDEKAISGNEIEFNLDNVHLESREDFEKLTSGYKKLAKLIINNSDCGGSLGEYRDMFGADVRLMRIEYDKNDMPHISVAEIK